MDFTSIEFYTIAFFVAMGLVGFFMGQKKTKPASSHIDALNIDIAVDESQQGTVKLVACNDGKVRIERKGLILNEGESINLIGTIIDDKITIEEKKGQVVPTGKESLYQGEVTVDYFPPGKVYVRYESSATGQWCKLAFDNHNRNYVEKEMRY